MTLMNTPTPVVRSTETSSAKTPSTESLPSSLEKLIVEIEASSDLGPSAARQLLLNSDVTAQDLLPWADFSHPTADSYGRRLVWQGPYYELMVMSWVDGDMAAIHDHGYTQWGAVKFFGRPEHAIFRFRDEVLCTAERRVFADGDVVSVSHDLVHQMGNVGQDPFLSLHFYGCYGRDADITAEARLYELDENAIQITSGGVFFDLPESEIERRDEAPKADFPTTLRHKVELLSRLARNQGSAGDTELRTEVEQRLAHELFAPDGWKQTQLELHSRAPREPEGSIQFEELLQQELAAADRLQQRLGLTG